MIYVFYFVVGLYGVGFFGGLAVSWLIQRFGTFGSDHSHNNIKPPEPEGRVWEVNGSKGDIYKVTEVRGEYSCTCSGSSSAVTVNIGNKCNDNT